MGPLQAPGASTPSQAPQPHASGSEAPAPSADQDMAEADDDEPAPPADLDIAPSSSAPTGDADTAMVSLDGDGLPLVWPPGKPQHCPKWAEQCSLV